MNNDVQAAVERLRALHQHLPSQSLLLPKGVDYCSRCLIAWPCDTIQALDALQQAETERDRALQAVYEGEQEVIRYGERMATAEAERDAAYESRNHWCIDAGKVGTALDAVLKVCAAIEAIDDSGIIESVKVPLLTPTSRTVIRQARKVLDERGE
jgi:hypothetical protein